MAKKKKTGGWVKIYRSMLTSPMLQAPDAVFVWVYLLLNAKHRREQREGGIILEPGDVLVSIRKLARESKIAETTVRRILNNFEQDKMIVARKRSRKGTHLTICNWETYQNPDEESGAKALTQRRSNVGSKVGTIKKEKKVKKEKKLLTQQGGSGGVFSNFDTEAAFREFWTIYPRKAGRQAARIAFSEALRRLALESFPDPYEWLRERIRAYADSDRVRHGFALTAADFLNGERYHDADSEWMDRSKRASEDFIGD